METCLLPANAEGVRRAAELLRAGEVVGIPTETVYGLAANAWDEEAVRRIFVAKGRPQDNPLIVHIADREMLYEVAARVPEQALALADAFWPGPLTIILPRGPKVADAVCAGLDTVGIRMPSHPAAQAVIRASGLPLAAPSANRSGAPSPTDAKTVWEDMQGRLPLILDGGECQVGVESTVVSLAGDVPMVLRPGYVTPEQMSQVLGCPVQVAGAVTRQLQAGETVRSPGMKYKHYAPKAEVTIVRGDRDTFARYVAAHPAEGLFCLCFAGDEAVLEVPCVHYGTEQDPAAQAHDLFSALRRLDELGAKTVYARCPEMEGVGLAVYNRLLRAAAFRVVEP